MNGNREGEFVTRRERLPGDRETLHVYVAPGTWMVGTMPVPVGDWQPKSLQTASRAFAQKLYAISKTVADGMPDDPEEPDYAEKLEQSLHLNDGQRFLQLEALRTIGHGPRSELPAGVVEQLQFDGFVQDAEGQISQDAPALTFQEGWQAPILWEMMYEGSLLDEADWRKFWGFAVPVAHWLHAQRTEEIRLRSENGFFSAIAEDLDFAGQEVDLLASHFARPFHHFSLAESFRHQVEEALRQKWHEDDGRIEEWLQTAQSQWLQRFLNEQYNEPAVREARANLWKRQALVNTFQKCHNSAIIHFACHCEPSAQTEFLSQLKMKVAGEPVMLDVTLLASEEMERKLSYAREPGPLVFLNACGTAEQAESFEPPGFPDKWIRKQGALAVVATLCPVPDYFAHRFATKFYELLFQALEEPQDPEKARYRFVAEALLETRRYFMEEYNNPLGLAYTLYAFRGAYVRAEI